MTDDAAVVDGGATAAMVNTRQGLFLGDRSLATSGGTNAARLTHFQPSRRPLLQLIIFAHRAEGLGVFNYAQFSRLCRSSIGRVVEYQEGVRMVVVIID